MYMVNSVKSTFFTLSVRSVTVSVLGVTADVLELRETLSDRCVVVLDDEIPDKGTSSVIDLRFEGLGVNFSLAATTYNKYVHF